MRGGGNDFTAFVANLAAKKFVLEHPVCSFKPQVTRRGAKRRPATLNEFAAANFRFIYRNCAQLIKRQKDLDDLNDVLFSHVFFRDTGVQWNLLFASVFYAPNNFVCPICLEEPTAARMTPCGHVFCADCLVRFFEAFPSHACPVCSVIIPREDPIRCIVMKADIGETVRLVKVQRGVDTNICSRYGRVLEALPSASDPDSVFTRFTIADQQTIADMYRDELVSLELLRASYSELEMNERVASIRALEREITKDVVNIDETKFVVDKSDDRVVVFYQAENGSRVFLDGVTEDMLTDHFGSLLDAPDVIEAKVLLSSGRVVDPDVGYQNVAFDHLPTGTETKFVLLDLTDLVSEDVLRRYACRLNLACKPKRSKTKRPQRVINQEDYQTFSPAPEVQKVLTAADFPSLSSALPVQRPVRTPKRPPPELSEAFPSLGGVSVPVKRTSTPATWKVGDDSATAPTTDTDADCFPSLSGKLTVAVQQPKRASGWSKLKL